MFKVSKPSGWMIAVRSRNSERLIGVVRLIRHHPFLLAHLSLVTRPLLLVALLLALVPSATGAGGECDLSAPDQRDGI